MSSMKRLSFKRIFKRHSEPEMSYEERETLPPVICEWVIVTPRFDCVVASPESVLYSAYLVYNTISLFGCMVFIY